jgi:hypothetical protein
MTASTTKQKSQGQRHCQITEDSAEGGPDGGEHLRTTQTEKTKPKAASAHLRTTRQKAGYSVGFKAKWLS